MKDDDKDKTNLVLIAGSKRIKRKPNNGDDANTGLSPSAAKNILLFDLKTEINGGSLGFKCHVVKDKRGVANAVVVNENREVFYVDDAYIIDGLLNKFEQSMKSDSTFALNYNDAKHACSIWKSTDSIPEPKKLGWLSDTELCFKRLSFDYEKKDQYKHPYFDQLLNKIISDKEAFMDFIGSIFVEDSSNQNYLWCYGQGADGKGSIFNMLQVLLGEVCTSLFIPKERDAHWAEQLLGKRLGIFSDVNNMTWTTSGFFKMLTGGDYIPINPKNKSHYSILPNMKFIFASNFKPEITSKTADKRRLIYCEFEPADFTVYENLGEKLVKESKEIINHCVSGYLKRYTNRTPIVSDLNSKFVDDLAKDSEEDFHIFLEEKFQIKKSCYVTPSQMNTIIKENHIDRKRFLQFLETNFKIKQSENTRVSDFSTPRKLYLGIKANSINNIQVIT